MSEELNQLSVELTIQRILVQVPLEVTFHSRNFFLAKPLKSALSNIQICDIFAKLDWLPRLPCQLALDDKSLASSC